MIPRIDPHSLLKCLSVLLDLSGGIKSKEDVARIVSLMSKFSKKLVSKCVYVEILHATKEDLLGVYMNDGGWELVSTWIMDSVETENGPLLETLLALTLKADLGLSLLEANDCPRVVKTLTSNAPNERVKTLATELVARWIEVAKKGLEPADLQKAEEMTTETPGVTVKPEPPADPNQVLTEEQVKQEVSMEEEEEAVEEEEEEAEATPEEDAEDEDSMSSKPLGELPVYKITIRDGKQVLATVSSAKPNTVNIPAEELKPEEVPPTEPVRESPRGASRRKQQLKPVDEPLIMTETEKKRVAAHDKKLARLAKEAEAKRAEKIFKEKNLKKLKEGLAEREAKKKALKLKEQEEKDQATLAKLMGGGNKISLGKIPKKIKTDEGDRKSSDSPKRTSTEDGDKKNSESRRSSTDDDRKKKSDSSKSSSSKDRRDSRSSSSKSSSPSPVQPVKHKVKTFNSKFRSTGLEEEPPLPPPRGQTKKDIKDGKVASSGKRSPPPFSKEQTPPEKKSKLDEVVKKVSEKPRAKPGIQLLQESNFFMDALEAGVKNEPRKRKRRVSSSKDDTPPAKSTTKESSPSSEKKAEKSSPSPTSVRPTFKFYTDTLETAKSDVEIKEMDDSENDKNSDNRTPTPPIEGVVEEPSEHSELQNDPGKGVLVIHRSIDRVKKSVRFKSDDELVSIQYFELDETERVNVTKMGGLGTDMKMNDAAYERSVMANVKKMNSMEIEEKADVPWRLILIDCSAPLAELGRDSTEKVAQMERERTVLQAIYFSPESIPDSPMEPEVENHPILEPKEIPMDDVAGNPDSVKDYSLMPWVEPKGFAPVSPAPMAAGGGWRTGDGQILTMNSPMDPFQQPPPNFNQGYETGNPMGNFGYQTPNFNPQDMGMNGMNPNMNMNPNMMGMMNNMMMAGGAPNFMQFPPNVNNFNGPPPGNWGPPMGGFRGRGNNMGRGGPGRGYFGPPRGGPRDRPSNVCKHFARGFCRNGTSCKFRH